MGETSVSSEYHVYFQVIAYLANTYIYSATVMEERYTFWMNQMSADVTIAITEDDVYDGCGVSKSCYGLPDGCINSRSCISFGAVIVTDGVYRFEMKSTTDTSSKS